MHPSNSNEVVIPVPVSVDTDLVIDDDGYFYLSLDVYLNENEDESHEIKIPFSELVDDLLVFYKEEYGVDGYKTLYSVAHELSRQAERLRESAQIMEESLTATADLFDQEDTAK